MEFELRHYLPCGWQVSPSRKILRLVAPSEEQAQKFLESAINELIRSAKNLKRPIELSWQGCNTPLRISPKLVAESGQPLRNLRSGEATPSTRDQKTVLKGLIQSSSDIDWNTIHSASNPIYINDLATQDNLFLNNAAYLAQSGKPPKEFLSATAHALNFEDELLARCHHLRTDGHLSEYNYEALRWFRDPSGLWIRRKMKFISNFWRVQYLGLDCWMGEVLQAEPLERFVDNP